MTGNKMELCKNSKCKQRLSCKRYVSLLSLAETGKLKDHDIKIFEFTKDKCNNFIKLKR